MQRFASVERMVERLRPTLPVHCLDEAALAATARAVAAAFPGRVLYAVKCNAHPAVLAGLAAAGVGDFDVASLGEVRLLRALLPAARLHFMHPVKPEDAIAEAFAMGVRTFAFDHPDELVKIVRATGGAPGLDLVVRMEVPRGLAALDLSGKFGCAPAEAATLAAWARALGHRVGLTFHVGSQCVEPRAFAQSVRLAGEVAAASEGLIDILDVGGGFPGGYGGEPGFSRFVEAIVRAVEDSPALAGAELRCEPGRGLVAGAVELVTRVDLRRDGALYLNDGVYGGLAELKYLGPVFPMRRLRPGYASGRTAALAGFDLFGPTCDSVDAMPGPHWLPEDMATGDWIAVGRMGAYSNALRTGFNGFEGHDFVRIGA